ncbi:MAG: AAA family ATPase [Spirochaetales bacterium]|nr:AAA family ATPase [Spirochaetales bacterium]
MDEISSVKKIYVAASRQNDGKTITALGLLEAVKEFYPNTGYIKPVGQQVKIIGQEVIDKDVNLMNEVFKIGGQLPDMSPITVPSGFTENYILHGNKKELETKIMDGYNRASKSRDFMVIEGTGHAGVGSVFDLSNAEVAKLLNAKVILVTCAGIGRPIDEIMLNKALFDQHGIELLGVIINKVLPEKYEKINYYVRLGLKRKNIDVLGVIPYCPILSNPTVKQLLDDVKGELICGEKGLDQMITNVIVGAMPPHTVLDFFKGEVLLITPGNREDLILSAVTCALPEVSDDYNIRGIILTGGIWPNKTILKFLKNTSIPIFLVKEDTFAVAQRVTNLIVKIRPEDQEKIDKIKELVKQYVDVKLLRQKIENT